jgi:hypothetical protein
MRKRQNAAPRLEAMEGRVAPSFLGIHVPSWVTADVHKMGSAISGYAKHAKSDLESLNQHRAGQSVQTTWPTSHTAAHKTSNTLFGIPWLKI